MASESAQQQQKSQVISPPARPPFAHPKSIFLAGTTVKTDWRASLKATLAHLPVTILDPFRSDWDGSWKEDISFKPFREQVEWELDMQDKADLIVVYFHPETMAPVSLLELGLCTRSGKAIVACPAGYWKRGNVQVVCRRFDIPLVESYEQLVDEVMKRFGESG